MRIKSGDLLRHVHQKILLGFMSLFLCLQFSFQAEEDTDMAEDTVLLAAASAEAVSEAALEEVLEEVLVEAAALAAAVPQEGGKL